MAKYFNFTGETPNFEVALGIFEGLIFNHHHLFREYMILVRKDRTFSFALKLQASKTESYMRTIFRTIKVEKMGKVQDFEALQVHEEITMDAVHCSAYERWNPDINDFDLGLRRIRAHLAEHPLD